MSAASSPVSFRDRAIARTLPYVPRPMVRRFAAPYIAGDTVAEAMETIRGLSAAGMTTTLDVLGEAVTSEQMAFDTRDAYLTALDELHALGDGDLVNVSVKLTALGLAIDLDLARSILHAIVDRATEHGGFVRIDMEDSPYTDQTLMLFRELWDAGHHNVGVVVQAYLKRSREDVEELARIKAPVRIVKGIYIEPEAIAYRDGRVINRNFLTLAGMLADAGCRAAYATHDEVLVYETQRMVAERELTAEHYEYQMLLGVREELRDDIVSRGHPMRIYVPYGSQWYEYSLRRLRENPQIAGYVTGDVMRSLAGKVGLRPRRKRRPRPGVERRW